MPINSFSGRKFVSDSKPCNKNQDMENKNKKMATQTDSIYVLMILAIG